MGATIAIRAIDLASPVFKNIAINAKILANLTRPREFKDLATQIGFEERRLDIIREQATFKQAALARESQHFHNIKRRQVGEDAHFFKTQAEKTKALAKSLDKMERMRLSIAASNLLFEKQSARIDQIRFLAAQRTAQLREENRELLTQLVTTPVTRLLALGVTGLAATGAAFGIVASQAFKFQHQLKILETVSIGTGVSFETLRQRSIELATRFGMDMTEVARALTILERTGLKLIDDTESLNSLFAVMRLNALDAGFATEFLARMMTIFSGEGLTATQILERTHVAARESILGFEDFATLLKFAAPFAKNVGIEFNELLAVMTAMGTRLPVVAGREARRLFIDMLSRMEDFERVLSSVGATVIKTKDGNVDLLATMSLLASTMKTDEERARLLTAVISTFGSEASTAFATILNSMKDVDGLLKKIDGSTGALDEAMKKFQESFQFRFEKIKASFLAVFGSPQVMEMMDRFIKVFENTAVIEGFANVIVKLGVEFLEFIEGVDFAGLVKQLDGLSDILGSLVHIFGGFLYIVEKLPTPLLQFLVITKLLLTVFPLQLFYTLQLYRTNLLLAASYEAVAAAAVQAAIAQGGTAAGARLARGIGLKGLAGGVGLLGLIGGPLGLALILASIGLTAYLAYAQTGKDEFRRVLRSGPAFLHEGEVVGRPERGATSTFGGGGGSIYNIDNLTVIARNLEEFESELRRYGLK